MKLKTIILTAFTLCTLSVLTSSSPAPTSSSPAPTGDLPVPVLQQEYPRMTDRETASEQKSLAKAHAKVDRYVEQHVDDPEWIVSRLQMHWKSHASVIYIKGETLDHVEGYAPVPTVRYPANRGGQTAYARPSLEETKPYQDSLGLWLRNRNTGEMEWVDPREAGTQVCGTNITIMELARDAARIWWLTGDEKYAKFASDIFDTYMTGLYYREVPIDLNHGHQQTLVGLTSFEVIHENIVMPATECYDYLHDYLVNARSEKMGIYDDAFRKWADVIIAGGVPQNNWNLIQAQFILRIALVLGDNESYADGKGRNYYINYILNEDSIRQWSIGKMIDYGFDKHTGLWKESPGYSTMVLGEFDSFVHMLHKTTGINLVETYPILAKAAKALPQYVMPDGHSVCWGDGHYGPLKTNFKFLETIAPEDYPEYQTPTFWSEDVSWFVARSGNDPQNSLLMSVVGSEGNHMHANGISMELYGKGYIQAPDLGRGAGYTTFDYLEFYSQFPAHNTVCVDGVSSYPVMESHHPLKLVDCYPLPEEKEYEEGLMFGEFSFLEPETQSDQLRQLLMVTEDPDCGYYVDIFRSRRQDGKDETHDYFYHNIGQDFTLNMDLEPTEELAFAGAHLYAYSYIWNKQAALTSADVEGCFTMTCPDGSKAGMKMWMRGEDQRRIFKAYSPMIDALTRTPMPYDIKNSPCQTYVARQYGEAWDRPFVAVYQPYATGDVKSVASVEYFGEGYVGIKVTLSDGSVNYIFSSDKDMKMSHDGIETDARLCFVSDGRKFISRGTYLKVNGKKIIKHKKNDKN
ncbi:MAG: heparinase II/III family protein [Bacteroidales bacterium]|nr:heparinase II/III family protein [Bacteroidales bacterium]